MYPGTHAVSTPDKLAVASAERGQCRTFAELDENSARLARTLYDYGLRRGDTVALIARASTQCSEVFWGAMRSGLYVLPLDPDMAPEETAYIVNDSGARAVVAAASAAELAESIVSLTPHVDIRLAFSGFVESHRPYEETVRTAGPRLVSQPRGGVMLYRRASTGRPRSIRPPLPAQQVDAQGDVLASVLEVLFRSAPDEVYLSVGPAHEPGALTLPGVAQSLGCTVVMLDTTDAEAIISAVERHGVTVAGMLPQVFRRLLALPKQVRVRYDMSSLRAMLPRGSRCPADVADRMVDWLGPILREWYPLEAGAVHVCDNDGREVAPGEPGVVYLDLASVGVVGPALGKVRAARHPTRPDWVSLGDIGSVERMASS